jgi:hypothetical protein
MRRRKRRRRRRRRKLIQPETYCRVLCRRGRRIRERQVLSLLALLVQKYKY